MVGIILFMTQRKLTIPVNSGYAPKFTKRKVSMNNKEKIDTLTEEEIRKKSEERLVEMDAVKWAIRRRQLHACGIQRSRNSRMQSTSYA